MTLPTVLGPFGSFKALAILLYTGVLNIFSAVLLADLVEEEQLEDPNDIAEVVGKIHRLLKMLVFFSTTTYTYASSVSYLDVGSASMTELLCLNMSREAAICVFAVLMLLAVFYWKFSPRNLGRIAFVMTVFQVLLLIVGVGSIRFSVRYPQLPAVQPEAQSVSGFAALTVALFAYFGHTPILPMARRYEGERKVPIAIAWAAVIALYAAVVLISPSTNEVLLSQALDREDPSGIIFRVYALVACAGSFISFSIGTWSFFLQAMDRLGWRDRLASGLGLLVTVGPPIALSLTGIYGHVLNLLEIAGLLGAGLTLIGICMACAIRYRGAKRLLSAMAAAGVLLPFLLG